MTKHLTPLKANGAEVSRQSAPLPASDGGARAQATVRRLGGILALFELKGRESGQDWSTSRVCHRRGTFFSQRVEV
jgi:hypothetical protein